MGYQRGGEGRASATSAYQMLFLIVFTLVLLASVFTIFIKTDNTTIDLSKEPKPKFEWIDKNAMPIGIVLLFIFMAYGR